MFIFVIATVSVGFLFIGWSLGGIITGIIFSQDAPINHKICWFISGVFSVVFIFSAILLDSIL